MKRLSRYNEAIRLGAVIDSKAPAGGTAAGTLVILPVYETVQVPGLGATSTSLTAAATDIQLGYVVQPAAASKSFLAFLERD